VQVSPEKQQARKHPPPSSVAQLEHTPWLDPPNAVHSLGTSPSVHSASRQQDWVQQAPGPLLQFVSHPLKVPPDSVQPVWVVSEQLMANPLPPGHRNQQAPKHWACAGLDATPAHAARRKKNHTLRMLAESFMRSSLRDPECILCSSTRTHRTCAFGRPDRRAA